MINEVTRMNPYKGSIEKFHIGDIVIHFKNNKYQILNFGQNTDNNKLYVIYQALYGEFNIWIRSIEEFLSEVDFNKYPKAKQVYRFEKEKLI